MRILPLTNKYLLEFIVIFPDVYKSPIKLISPFPDCVKVFEKLILHLTFK